MSHMKNILIDWHESSPRRALITGITGQDGSYLAELLLDKGYEVHGIVRRSSTFSTERIEHIRESLHLHYGDLSDANCVTWLLREVEPHEVYNLAAQSHVRVSFDQPVYTADVTAIGTLRLLEGMRHLVSPPRFYQASSSEMYGNAKGGVERLDESTPFNPASPYAVSKVFAHQMTQHYRSAYGLHASCGILFNHESPRRGETFVTRKITRALGRIKYRLQQSLLLGEISPKRDWGYAPDYVEAMWLMLQQDEPDDYVIATGESYSVGDFLSLACAVSGIDATKCVQTGVPRLTRPEEVRWLRGDASKAKLKLGWQPRHKFEEIVSLMVESDEKLARREAGKTDGEEHTRDRRNWLSWAASLGGSK